MRENSCTYQNQYRYVWERFRIGMKINLPLHYRAQPKTFDRIGKMPRPFWSMVKYDILFKVMSLYFKGAIFFIYNLKVPDLLTNVVLMKFYGITRAKFIRFSLFSLSIEFSHFIKNFRRAAAPPLATSLLLCRVNAVQVKHTPAV